jgi:bacterial/archaeal transporter family-2 protein
LQPVGENATVPSKARRRGQTMTGTLVLAVAVAVAAGVAIAVQVPVNAGLARGIGGAVPAAAVSFGVGFLALAALTLVSGQGAAFARLGTVAPVFLIGGVFGAFYVWAMTWGVPQAGVVTIFSALILGQMGAALVLDATGAFGLPVQEITATRAGAAALVAAGVVLSRL